MIEIKLDETVQPLQTKCAFSAAELDSSDNLPNLAFTTISSNLLYLSLLDTIKVNKNSKKL